MRKFPAQNTIQLCINGGTFNGNTTYNQEFKNNAVSYYREHADLGISGCANNLGIGKSTLAKWVKLAKKSNGKAPYRGLGNYSSDAEKENARFRRELRDTKDALDVLKKLSIFWENDRSDLYCVKTQSR